MDFVALRAKLSSRIRETMKDCTFVLGFTTHSSLYKEMSIVNISRSWTKASFFTEIQDISVMHFGKDWSEKDWMEPAC